jgi:hypothetical protein
MTRKWCVEMGALGPGNGRAIGWEATGTHEERKRRRMEQSGRCGWTRQEGKEIAERGNRRGKKRREEDHEQLTESARPAPGHTLPSLPPHRTNYPSHAEYAASSVTVTHPNETREKKKSELSRVLTPSPPSTRSHRGCTGNPFRSRVHSILGSSSWDHSNHLPHGQKVELLFRVAMTGPRRVYVRHQPSRSGRSTTLAGREGWHKLTELNAHRFDHTDSLQRTALHTI